ncbi:MAG: hypothetical protein HY672_01015 [Chloroflexi bacterium]|nr:hypothetical protein [Chloroflexota bacterium]
MTRQSVGEATVDIVVRGSDWMTHRSTLERLEVQEETYFYRGKEPIFVSAGDRVYFIEDQATYGFAFWHEYAYRKSARGQVGYAFVVRGPWTAIDPPQQLPDDFLRGQWRWRYVTSVVDSLLRR